MPSSLPRGRSRAVPVTLLTDFGLRDPYVGTMKGVILSINPRAVTVDLTHGIAAQAIVEGAFALEAAWRYFPRGTVHISVVDPGVGSPRAAIALSAGEHFFVGPDNGLLEPILERHPEAKVHRIETDAYRLERVSRTFHGRDIFAPAAAWLSRGVPIEALGPVHEAPSRLAPLTATRTPDGWSGQVIYADIFGNLVTNLAEELLEGDPERWRVRIGDREVPVARTYADVAPGALVAVVGSFERLEIAVNRGAAREELALEAGVGVVLVRVRSG